jgi:predicted NAD/FAD-dependent oxidoreductase
MLFLYPTLVVVLLTQLDVVADENQIPSPAQCPRHRSRAGTNPVHVAIIGAGIAGASAAFRLHELARPFPSLNITIYESEAGVGGRIKSIFPPENRRVVVEVGATYFFRDDWNIIAAMNNVGLKEKGSISLWLRRGLWVCGMTKSLERRQSAMESPSRQDVVRLGWK